MSPPGAEEQEVLDCFQHSTVAVVCFCYFDLMMVGVQSRYVRLKLSKDSSICPIKRVVQLSRVLSRQYFVDFLQELLSLDSIEHPLRGRIAC